MNSACLPNTAAYTFNGGHVGGQAIFESVHPPLAQGGGGRRRRAARKSTRRRRSARKTARRSARKTARRSARKTARRSARKTARRSAGKVTRKTSRRTTRRSARKVQGRRAVYREADKSMMTGAGRITDRMKLGVENFIENNVVLGKDGNVGLNLKKN